MNSQQQQLDTRALELALTAKTNVVQLGAKIKLSHNGVQYADPVDYWKGVTFEINPAKDVS